MKPFKSHTGIAAPLDRADVDTDQIIPKQFLSRVERTGYGQFLFNDWRRNPDGSLDSSFVLNRSPYDEATVLLTGRNFGCGSSREHAAWALTDFGFRAVIAPSFADIFRSNSDQNGLLCVVLPQERIEALLAEVRTNPGAAVTVDLESLEVRADNDFVASFKMDDFRRQKLLNGWDLIDLTLGHVSAISAFEERFMDSPGRAEPGAEGGVRM